MASAGALTIDLNANTTRLRSDFTKAAAMTKKYKRESIAAFKKVSGAVLSLKGAVFGLAGIAGIGALTKTFVTAASTSEQYAVRLKVLLGSVEEGNRLFKDMTAFASKVPFEYQNIMNSATQLAGVMKGGVDEINQWMPLIGDLAATSGLSIEETTEQIVRMYSAGAASADKFRERGILSMLGFQAGVSVSAEKTREKLLHEWTKQGSQFRGATAELAQTWDGMMSMLSDKWFQFRVQIMKGGLFDWLKGLVAVINGKLGDAVDGTSKKAKRWSENIIDAIESVVLTVAFLADTLTGIKIVFKVLEIAAWGFATAVNTIADTVITPIIQGWIEIAKLFGMEIKSFTFLTEASNATASSLSQATKELKALAEGGGARSGAQQMLAEIRREAEGIANAASSPLSTGGSGGGSSTDNTGGIDPLEMELRHAIRLEDELDALHSEREAVRAEQDAENARLWGDLWIGTANNVSQGIGDAFADALIEQKNMGEALKSLMKSVAKSVVSGLVQIAIKRTLLNAKAAAEEKAIVLSGMASAASLAVAYAPAAAAASLASFGANSVPAMEGIAATHALSSSLSLAGQAHNGMDYVPKEGSYNLQRGEMVLDPGTSQQVRDNLVGGGNALTFAPVVQAFDADDVMQQKDALFNGMRDMFVDWMNEEGLSFS